MSIEVNVEEKIGNVASNLIEKGGRDGMNELVDNVQEQDEEHQGEEHDEDESGDEEVNDEDAVGEYTLTSEDEMYPLAFTEDDVTIYQAYPQFELLENEYEALAAKKRKALATQDSQRENLVRKLGLDDITGVSIEELLDDLNYGRMRKKSKKCRKRGRRKGSKNKVNPEITRKIGDANVHYAHQRYEEAIHVLYEVVRIATHLPDPYHTLGLVYHAMGDKMKALDFYMLAANLSPRDAFRWELAVPLCIELENYVQAIDCLKKAIAANPEEISLMIALASLHDDLQDYQKAAESYERILRKFPNNFEALEKATMLYQKCGQKERSAVILEDYLKSNPSEPDLRIIDSLTAIYVKNGEHTKALQHIEHAKDVYCGGNELPPDLAVKVGICYAHLGDTEKAEIIFSNMIWENVNDPDLLGEAADILMAVGHYESALKYFLMLEENGKYNSGFLQQNIAHCYLNVKEKGKSIEYMYKALHVHEDNVDVRLDLATLLMEEDKEEEAIFVLSPPILESKLESNSSKCKPWWLNGRIKLKLCYIYRAKGWTKSFVEAIFSSIRDSLLFETVQQKVRVRKKLTKSELSKRAQVLDDHQTDGLFHVRPLASSSDLSKASRAKKLLQKRLALKEERKAAALAAGLDWNSDDSDEYNTPQQPLVNPFPNLLVDEEHHQLIVNLCKALVSLQRFPEAMEVINLTLKLASNSLSMDKQEELRSLGTQIPYNIADPTHCWDYVRQVVFQNPRSFAAWNSYYKVVSRLENRHTTHSRFLHRMRVKENDSIPPIIITGHQLNMGSHHQDAAREYLEAYKLMPDSPLINLCAGSTLIDLAFGHRLQKKHQCVLQGLSFLYNNMRLCENSQESLYNIARAYHHVGLVTLAAAYYEKVLAVHVDDYPIPKIANGKNTESDSFDDYQKNRVGHCDLRREAAYNLHLIYKNSGAIDLARQILKDHCKM